MILQPGGETMELLIKVAAVGAAVLVIGALLRAAVGGAGRVFSIRMTKSGPKAKVGKALGAFVEEVRLAAEEHGITSGRIDGVDEGGRVRLVFSKEFPEPCRQRLRNVWVALGWGERRKRGGRPDGGPRAKVR